MFDNSEITFERLSLDESLRRTLSVYRKGFLVFTKIALLVLGVSALLWVILLPILLSTLNVNGQDFTDPQYLVDHMKEFYTLIASKYASSIVIGAVGEGMMIKAVADIYLGRDPDFLDCLKLGFKKSGPIILVALVTLVCVSFGILILVAPGLYMAVIWFVVDPAIVIENYGVFGSMKRSRDLVAGSWCYVFCTLMIINFYGFFLQFIWSLIVVGGNDAGHTLFSVIGSTLALIPSLVILPVFGIVKPILYFNLRIEKEGLNEHVLDRNLGGSGAYNVLMGDTADLEACE